MGNPLAQLRNRQKENLQVKAGETPVEWNQQENKSVLAQKDLDARWTKKNKEKEEVLIAINIESRISEKRIKKSSSHWRTKSFKHQKI